jgi:hypothetical protein
VKGYHGIAMDAIRAAGYGTIRILSRGKWRDEPI